MANEVTKTKRPSSVTLISVFAIYAGVVLLYLMTRAGIQKYGVEETVFNVVSGIVFLISGIGLWLMKKWAVYLFAICAFANQIFLLLMPEKVVRIKGTVEAGPETPASPVKQQSPMAPVEKTN